MKDNAATVEVRRQVHRLQRAVQNDREEQQAADTVCLEYLKQALEAYAQCMHYGDQYDTTAVFRLCALWLSNSHVREVWGLRAAGGALTARRRLKEICTASIFSHFFPSPQVQKGTISPVPR